ncbi:MAG: FAD:protein FMN transferase [Fidelibacterota bacterium]
MINSVKISSANYRLKAQLLLGFLVFILLATCSREPELLELHGFTMGTAYSVKIVPKNDQNLDLGVLKQAIDSILQEVNAEMSPYIPESQISGFNSSAAGTFTKISPGFLAVIQRSLQWYDLTRGAFNIAVMPLLEIWGFGPWEQKNHRAPPDSSTVQKALKNVRLPVLDVKNSRLLKDYTGQSLDLGAIAKGWGVDQVYAFIKHQGIRNYIVEIGGEIRTRGVNASEKSWIVGIDTPVKGSLPGQNLSAVVPISDKALATSGDYRNFFEYKGQTYNHIINPNTGYPVDSGIASVSVIAPNCTDADALATALMVLNPTEGLELIESLEGYEAYWIIRGGDGKFTTAKSSGMKLSHSLTY